MSDNYDRLTNEAKYFLLQIYDSYLTKIKSGMDRSKAKDLGSITQLKELLPDETEANVTDYFNELKFEEFVVGQYGSGKIYRSALTNVAIARMQNRFKNGVKSAIDLLSKLR